MLLRAAAASRLLAIVVVAAVAGGNAAGLAGAQDAPYHLASIRPYLFFNDSGQLSSEVPEHATLWNTIIGEGWAGQSSNSTLVRVEVRGPGGSFVAGRSVRLIVRKGKMTPSGVEWHGLAAAQGANIPVLTRRGRTILGFWIANTGCTPLQLTAELRGQAPLERLTRVLNFACGE